MAYNTIERLVDATNKHSFGEQLPLNHRNLEANRPTLPKTLRIQSAGLIAVANAVPKQLKPDRKRAPPAVSPLIFALRNQ
jgi:hypothetical protein